MDVSSILKNKGNDVTCVAPDAHVLDVVRTLAHRRIGAALVRDGDDRIVGIVSERDVIRCIAKDGPQCLDAPVSRIMTRDVVSCRRSDTVDQVMRTMTSGRFRHMPVKDGDELVGVVSIGDVVKHHIAEVEMEANSLRSYIVSS